MAEEASNDEWKTLDSLFKYDKEKVRRFLKCLAKVMRKHDYHKDDYSKEDYVYDISRIPDLKVKGGPKKIITPAEKEAIKRKIEELKRRASIIEDVKKAAEIRQRIEHLQIALRNV